MVLGTSNENPRVIIVLSNSACLPEFRVRGLRKLPMESRTQLGDFMRFEDVCHLCLFFVFCVFVVFVCFGSKLRPKLPLGGEDSPCRGSPHHIDASHPSWVWGVRQTDGQTDRQTQRHRQTDGQTDLKTNNLLRSLRV